ICELMPRLAKLADKYTILRSVGIKNETWEHSGGLYWLTGNPRRQNPPTPKYPMYGHVMAKLRPAPKDTPSFMALGPINNHSGDIHINYLGPAHDPLVFNPEDKSDETRDMLTSPGLDLSAAEQRENLLKSLDGQLRRIDALDPVIASVDRFQQKALDFLRSP